MATLSVPLIDDDSKAKRRAPSEEWSSNKKFAMSSPTDTPTPVNGILDADGKGSARDPETEADLERFRKAAVYRRMLAYRRGQARAEQRIAELVTLLKQANLKRFESDSCWSSTVSAIRRLTPVAALEKEAGPILKKVFPSATEVFTSDDFESASVPSERVEAAEQIIRAFLELAGKADRPDYQELFSESQGLQQRNEFLHAQLRQTHLLLTNAERDRDMLSSELAVAQSKIDRLQSGVLYPISNSLQDAKPGLNGDNLAPVSRSPTPHVKAENVKVEASDDNAAPSLQISAPESGITSHASDGSVEFSALKNENERLLERVAELRAKLEKEETKSSAPDIDAIVKLPIYRACFDQALRSEQKFKNCWSDLDLMNERCEFLQTSRAEWQKEIQEAAIKAAKEAHASLDSRDEEILRLKTHRDELLTEKRGFEDQLEAKWTHATKLQELADTRENQVAFLTNENKRLKTRLAATSGDEDLYMFLTNNKDASISYVHDLQRRLRSAESALDRLGKEGSRVTNTAVLQELQMAKSEVQALKSAANAELTAKLQEEVKTLKLVEAQNAEEIQALYQEVENMGHSLDESAKKLEQQVMNLEKWEEERDRLIGAKTRADTKYFKTCSEIEAKENERRAIVRELEKRVEVERKLQEIINAQTLDLSSVEKQLKSLETERNETQKRMHTLEQQRDMSMGTARQRSAALETTTEKLNHLATDIEASASRERIARDEVIELKKRIMELKESSKSSSSRATPSLLSKGDEADLDILRKLLKCSTCKESYRNVVITKCMHTFCKQCIDTRLSVRNRKCPYCSIVFGKEDVQTVYFQG